MRLGERLTWLSPLAGREVTSLSLDSRRVVPGALFFALRGTVHDGSAFAEQAVARGAVGVVSDVPRALSLESSPSRPASAVWITVADPRQALADACRLFFGRDHAQTHCAGVTGTNGKTTITYLFEAIMRAQGRRVGVMGTIEHRLGEKRWPTAHTTVDAISLCERLVEMEQSGIDWLVMEVTSHGLDQRRIDPLRYDVAGFSNLTLDHLDYHHSMESYFTAKSRLFSELLLPHGTAVIFVDAPYGREMAKLVRKGARLMTVSRSPGADIQILSTAFDQRGMAIELLTPVGRLPLESPLIGDYNAENIALACGMAIAANAEADAVVSGIRSATVPGRLEMVPVSTGATAFVDYAHTPDALERALLTLNQIPHQRLWCVFGCGGDRDKSKRSQMGRIAAQNADLVVVTSDNPRTEPAEQIISGIVQGITPAGLAATALGSLGKIRGKGFAVEPDRQQAILAVAEQLCSQDLLLLAGKGHENYQIIGSEKIHFDDRELLRTALAKQPATAIHCPSGARR